jgi:hypothetical protein
VVLATPIQEVAPAVATSNSPAVIASAEHEQSEVSSTSNTDTLNVDDGETRAPRERAAERGARSR